MHNRSGFWPAASVIAIVLASCGGGDSGGSIVASSTPSGSTPAGAVPPPSPAPSPAPAPAPSPGPAGINARIGLHQLADFPTYGWFYRGAVAGEAIGDEPVGVGYDAARGLSTMTLPGYPVGGLMDFGTESTDDITYAKIDSSFGAATYWNGGFVAQLLVPGLQNTIFPLESTGIGFWHWGGISPPARLIGVITYGVPTAVAEVPVAGTGSYALHGYAVSRPAGAIGDPAIGHYRGTLTIDFATKSVTGSIAEMAFYGGTGAAGTVTFTISAATIGADGRFSGGMTVAGVSGTGSVEGRLTGPQGRELMLRWKAPFIAPASGRTETVYGAIAGRRN